MRYFLRLLFCITFMLTALYGSEKYQLVQIDLTPGTGIQFVNSLGIDLEGASYKKDTFVIVATSQKERERLTSAGLSWSVLVPDLKSFYQSRLEPQHGKGFGYGSMGGYYTYDEVIAQMDSMHAIYPDLISARISIGNSWQGRPLWAVKISDYAATDEQEPEALFTALHHAREPESMMTLLYFMWHLLDNYGSDALSTYLVNNRELWFIPIVNPDGYVYNQTTDPNGGGMWRKNRRVNGGGTFGVDLNRNYGYQWGFDDTGSSPYTDSETYRGPSAFSEPETQAIRDFCNSRHFTNALNYHTYSNLLIYPWAYSEAFTPDSTSFLRYAQKMTSVNNYTYGTPMQTVGYQVNGDSNDWMYGEQSSKSKILAMTPEVGGSGDGFWPASSRIVPLAQENLMPNLYYAQVAGGYVEITAFEIHNANNGYADPGETVQMLLTITNIGQSVSENADLHFSTSTPGIQIINPDISIPAINALDEFINSGTPLSISIDGSVVPGSYADVNYTVSVSNEMIIENNFRFRIGTPTVFFADNAESGMTNFTSSGNWGLTSQAFTSPGHSFTDSPDGNYPSNYDASLTSGNINLTNTDAAELSFKTKWNIETNWDFGTVEISTDNGNSWMYLTSSAMSNGSGSGEQPLDVYGFDGSQHDWIEQTINLSAYTGNTVKLRFHLKSDTSLEYDGWYVDDVSIYNFQQSDSIPPVIVNVEMLDATYINTTGYKIDATVHDNVALSNCVLWYKTGSKARQMMMNAINDSLFEATIPPQPVGTTVKYYIEAIDGQGNHSLAPAGAPDSYFSFVVTDPNANLLITPSALNFQSPRGLILTPDLMIKNNSGQNLQVNLVERLPVAKMEQPKQSLSTADIRAIINRLDFSNTPIPDEPIEMGNESKTVVIVDSVGDTNLPGVDLVSVAVSRSVQTFLTTTTFELTFNGPPDSSLIGFVSVDLDREMGSGAFPAPFGIAYSPFDIGSELELLFDVSGSVTDSLGLGTLAVALNPVDSSVVGVAPLTVNGNVVSAQFLYTPLTGGPSFADDFYISASFLSLTSFALPEVAPEFGHGTFGTELPVSWVSALPASFSLNAGDSLLMPLTITVSPPEGTYTVDLEFSDQTSAMTSVPLNLQVLAAAQPDLFVSSASIHDTLTAVDTTGSFLISNNGTGPLTYLLRDSIITGSNWFYLQDDAGIVEPGVVRSIPYAIHPENLQPGNTYQARVTILSNDPNQRFTGVDVFIYFTEPTTIGSGPSGIPETIVLGQNFPNPFNPETRLNFALPATGNVQLNIYNLLGQKVRTLVNDQLPAGLHSYTWHGKDDSGKQLASGVYIYELHAGQNVLRKKMLLLR